MIVLYARVSVKIPNGRKITSLGQFIVPRSHLLTDEICEQSLNQMAAQTLKKYPSGSVISNKEFISQGEYDDLCRIAEITHRKTGKHGPIYTIYIKAVGVFPDPENQYGFGTSGPEIPFYLYSSVPIELLNEEEQDFLKEKVISLCKKKYSRTPADIVFIEESEYNLLEQKFQEAEPEDE